MENMENMEDDIDAWEKETQDILLWIIENVKTAQPLELHSLPEDYVFDESHYRERDDDITKDKE